jgi:hypothetical protein
MLLNLEGLGWLMVGKFNGLAWTMQPPPGTPTIGETGQQRFWQQTRVI